MLDAIETVGIDEATETVDGADATDVGGNSDATEAAAWGIVDATLAVEGSDAILAFNVDSNEALRLSLAMALSICCIIKMSRFF